MLIGLCFGGKSKLSINKNQKIPYTVTPTVTGGFEATIDFFVSYKVVIPSATATYNMVSLAMLKSRIYGKLR